MKRIYWWLGGALALSLVAGFHLYVNSHESTREYVIRDVYVDKDIFIKENRQNCEDIYGNSDGSITMVLTDWQRKEWLDMGAVENQLRVNNQLISDGSLKIEYSDDYRKLTMWLPEEIAYASAPMIQFYAWSAELYQIFSGVEDWSLEVTVIETETERIYLEALLPEDELDWGFIQNGSVK